MTYVACLAFLAAQPALAQDSPKAMIDAASKRAASAKGKSGDELSAILKEAAGLYEQVVTRFPDAKSEAARAQLEIGRLRKRLGDFAAAEMALKQAASAAQETKTATEALHDLATLYRKTKRLPEAQQALERIVAEFPTEPRQRAEALVRLGAMHRQGKRFEAAEASFRQVLADHGDIWSCAIDALDDLVALKVAQGQDKEARTALASHGESLKTRYHGTRYEARIQPALDRISARLKIADDPDGE
jgi:tetratricopeptide (TPR) repeat protein